MPVPEPRFTIGVEEEYLLIDPETRDLAKDPPPELWHQSEEVLSEQVGPEFLRSQIEVGTKIGASIAEVRADLVRLRRAVIDIASDHGLAMIAASTHPFADPARQLHTDKERYNLLAQDLRLVVQRLLICGMHVHVGIDDQDLRVDLMSQVSYFLPHLLALSTSSPFWHREETGLKSYRTTVFRSMPRTGLPEHFTSWSEYRRHVDVLCDAGVIEDATKIWWDIRPSDRYPTLEMRSTDICTRIDDTMTIAALYVSLLRMLWQRRIENQRWRSYLNMLVQENVWRAQRYGVAGSLMDFGRGELVPYPDLVEELIELVLPAAEELDCVAEVEHAREIATRGTSADRQLATYRNRIERGGSHQSALEAVVDELIRDTQVGL